MNISNNNSISRRRLAIEWLESPELRPAVLLSPRKIGRAGNRTTFVLARPGRCGAADRWRSVSRGFTILEMMIVIGIIGLLTAMALPHLKGFTKANSMTTALRQLTDDVNLARQRSIANRSQVCMVFLQPNFWLSDQPFGTTNTQINNLYSHQYSAYALIGLRTVGDQPGVSNVHYLTDWKYLPQGIYIAPFQFTNVQNISTVVATTNTLQNISNAWFVTAFQTNLLLPFPSTYGTPAIRNWLPYICFLPSGQLATSSDQYIMLTSGSIFYQLNADGSPNYGVNADVVETPKGEAFSNPNMIHIDALTARATIERNQF